MRVLVVAPHPDDEVLGCGGTIARHVADGDTVDVLIVTRGDSSYDQTMIDESQAEAVAAGAVLGTRQTYFLDLPSPTLDTVPFRVVCDKIAGIVNHNILYVPWRGDVHQEHRIVHDACLVAARPPGPDIYAYETLSSTEWGSGFVPDHFVEIHRTLDLKLAALACYQTQIQEPPHPRSLLSCRFQAASRGSTIHKYAAEVFVTIRTTR